MVGARKIEINNKMLRWTLSLFYVPDFFYLNLFFLVIFRLYEAIVGNDGIL